MFDIDISRIRGNRFLELVWKIPCPQKILMVADSSLNFGTGGFGLSEFVSLIQGAGHTVSTAHRSGTGPTTIGGSYNFATAATAVTKANYDQIWLFGFSTAPLSGAEQTTIAQFMENGGGVFATGDHSTIGAGMGNNLPRVRGMRNWSSIPMSSPERHDTVLEHGADGVKQFDDQADALPQRIFPVFFSNGGSDLVASTWSVHPILRDPSGAVDYLPDHPHESECLAPTPVAGNFGGVEEWPNPTAGGPRIQAQVAAVSISAGRFIFGGSTKPPVKPRCFGAISAYDGDAAGVGRIVTDATWHHFVNINLNGSGAGNDPTTGLPRTGLYSGGIATPEYLKIQRYFKQTVRWLAPIGRRNCWPFIIATTVRFDFEMLELQLPDPHPCPWDPLLRIGIIAEETVTRLFGPGALADVVDQILVAADASPALTQTLKAMQLTNGDERKGRRSLLPLEDMRRVIFASVVNFIATQLPADEKKVESLLKKGHDDIAKKALAEGVRGAEAAINAFLDESLKQTSAFAKSVRNRK